MVRLLTTNNKYIVQVIPFAHHIQLEEYRQLLMYYRNPRIYIATCVNIVVYIPYLVRATVHSVQYALPSYIREAYTS
jgi:hypothetical protein